MPTTPDQLLEQSTRHAAHLERLKTMDVNELIKILEGIEDQVLGRLSQQDITQWPHQTMNRQIEAIRGWIQSATASDIVQKMEEQIADLAKYEAEFEVRNLKEAGVSFDFTLPSAEQVIVAVQSNPLSVQGPAGGQMLESFVRDWTEDQSKRVANTIRAGFAQGETTYKVVQNLREVSLPSGRRGLEAVARTSLQHAANQARQATWSANSDIVKQVQIVATLDSRTSTICQSLDGKKYPIDEGPRPPFHPNCRTTTVAVLDERFSFLEEGGSRRARNPKTGKVTEVSANETYYGWLKRQPKTVQDSIIGPTRGKLLRDGGISSQRFAELQLGRRFEPMTLEEMKKLEPVAFERAGLVDDE